MGIKQLLIVANDTSAAQLAFQLLEAGPYQLHLAETCEAARSILTRQRLDAILLGSPPTEHGS